MKNWYDTNIFQADCMVRYVVGGAALLGVTTLLWKAWVSLVSVYLVGTAIMRWDPVYWLWGRLTRVSGNKRDKPKKKQHVLQLNSHSAPE